MTGDTRVAIVRGLGLFALWVVLMQSAKPLYLAVGALAAIGATYASLRLLPPDAGRVRFVVLLALLPRFLWQSLKAGMDVAGRAFAPRIPLATGFVDYRTGFPRGMARNHFATITSLFPGSLPSGDGKWNLYAAIIVEMSGTSLVDFGNIPDWNAAREEFIQA